MSNTPSFVVSGNRVVAQENDSLVTGVLVVDDKDGMTNPRYTIIKAAKNGSATIDYDGNWSYAADPDWSGQDFFLVRVIDDAGFTSTQYVFVRSTNVQSAYDDTATVITNKTVNINVLENDTFIGDNKKVTHIDGQAVELGDSVYVENGIATLLVTGEVSFTPNEGYIGPTSFDYTVNTDKGTAETATVFVDVTPAVVIPKVQIDPIADSNNPTPMISGTTLPGTEVMVIILDANNNLIVDGLAIVNDDGTWTFVPGVPLVDGDYSVSAIASDGDNNFSEPSDEISFSIDLVAPELLIDELGLTTDATPTISGTGEVGSTITVTVTPENGPAIELEAVVNSNGTWSVDAPELADGDYEVSAVATDQVGNTSAESESQTLTVDTVLNFGIYGALDDEGHLYSGDVTDFQTPKLYGFAEEGTSITIRNDNGEVLQTITVDSTGRWEYQTVDTNQTERSWTIQATDLAGNTQSQGFNLFVNEDLAPEAITQDNSLLGLIGLDVAGVIDLNQQVFFAADVNNNLQKVVITQTTFIDLVALKFDYSAKLESELGLKVTAVDGRSLLGLGLVQLTESSITIEAAVPGQPISNQAILEFLGAVTLGPQAILGIDALGDLVNAILQVDVLSGLVMVATDTSGKTSTSTLQDLLGLGVLDNLLSSDESFVEEGTAAADTISRSSDTSNVRIYGHEGNDTLTGGSGNDIIRGGAGADTINGGAGNDYLNGGDGIDTINGGTGNDVIHGGAGNDIITGGAGADTVVLDLLNNTDATGGNGLDIWNDFSLAQGDTIDVSALLGPVAAYDLGQYVQLDYNASTQTVTVSIDRDGTGSSASGNVLLLTNQQSAITLDDLLQNQQILF